MTTQDNTSPGQTYKDKLYVLKEASCYKILGINSDANLETITKEYRNLAKQYHPDKFQLKSEDEKRQVSLIFQKITSAFNILKDPESRKKHDVDLRILEQTNKIEIKVPEIKRSDNLNIPINPNIKSDNITFTFTQMKPVDLDQIRAEKEKKDKERSKNDFENAKKLFDEKKYDDAINILRSLTEKFSSIAIYHSYLGLAMDAKGWNGYAQAEFKVALHFDPKDEIALKYYVPSGSKKIKEEDKKVDLDSTQNLKSVIGKFKSLFNKS